MQTPHTTKNGEITTKGALIDEIQNLLNALSVTSHETILSAEVMGALTAKT